MHQATKYNSEIKLTIGNGESIPICHTGSATLNSSKPIFLKNIIHSPQISKNLISVSQLTAHNNKLVKFDSNFFFVKDKTTKKVLLQGRSKDGLYQLQQTHIPSFQQSNNTSCHPSHKILCQFLKSCNQSFSLNKTHVFLQCLPVWKITYVAFH